MIFSMKTTTRMIYLLSAMLLSLNARADDMQLTGLDENAIPQLARPQAPPAQWHFVVGAGLAYLPRFQGASQHRVRPIPLVEASNGGFFAGTLNGIGYRFASSPTLQYGMRIGAAPGRKESADAHLAGMGDLKIAGEAGLFLKAKFDRGYLSSKVSAGSRGARAELGTGVDIQASDTDFLRFGVSANWASAPYMQTYFGVSADQAISSGLPAYAAAGGLQNYGVVASWSHLFDRHWLGNLALSGKRLANSARNSPLVQSASSNSVSCVAIYLF